MAFDSAIITYTTKTDKVDLVQAAHMNAVQSELVTIETILGTNVKGDRADVKTRLNNALDADGTILSGSAYPSPSLPSQLFYKTDVELLYVRNSTNTGWSLAAQNITQLGDYPANTNGTAASFICETDRELSTATSSNLNTPITLKEMIIPRTGPLRIKFNGYTTNNADSTLRIYRNDVAVGTARTPANEFTPGTQWAEDITGWTAGDKLQLKGTIIANGRNVHCLRLRVYELIPPDYYVNLDDSTTD